MRLTAPLACAALAALLSRPALAETTPSSTINQITVVAKGSKKYRYFHGALWMDFDKNRVNYRWGGLQCNGRTLSELKVSMLFAAFRSKYTVNLDYSEVLYKGKRYRCIDGFTVRR